jgi:hypothetical protein
VARNGLFNRHAASDEQATQVVDRDGDGVDDRAERSTTLVRDRDRNGVDDRTETKTNDDTETQVGRHSTVYGGARVIDRDGDGDRVRAPHGTATVPAPAETAPAPAAPPVTRVIGRRTSFLATLGLMLGVAAPLAALTGRLAPVGLALGVLGLLFALAGLGATARPSVSGRGVSMFALLLSAGGIVLAILAMNHAAPWLDSNVDEVAKLRQWLDARMPWMANW